MEKENSKSNLMTEGKIWKNILFFSIPLILGNLLQQLYNTADSIIVGNFVGSKALAAVGSSTSLIYLLIAFSQGASVGAGVIVAQFLGAKDKKATQDAVHTAFFIAIILGVVLTIGGVIFTPSILRLMGTPDDVINESITYLRLYSCGLIFNVVYNMSAGILNAAGNSKRSLIYLAYASVTNIILDIILISFLKMGVAGAAIATDISQVVSCVLALIFLMKSNDSYKVDLKKIKCHSKMAIRIIKIGLPTGIQNMVISFSNILVQASINSFGALAMAGFGAYMKIDGFNILPVMSFSMAVTTFVGQNYGAGKVDRVKKGIEAWKNGNIEEFGKLIFESGYSSIHNYEAGSDELRVLYDIMKNTDGIYGGRFSGAGFKGCCMALIEPGKEESIEKYVREEYLKRFPMLENKFSVHFCEISNGVNLS